MTGIVEGECKNRNISFSCNHGNVQSVRGTGGGRLQQVFDKLASGPQTNEKHSLYYRA